MNQTYAAKVHQAEKVEHICDLIAHEPEYASILGDIFKEHEFVDKGGYFKRVKLGDEGGAEYLLLDGGAEKFMPGTHYVKVPLNKAKKLEAVIRDARISTNVAAPVCIGGVGTFVSFGGISLLNGGPSFYTIIAVLGLFASVIGGWTWRDKASAKKKGRKAFSPYLEQAKSSGQPYDAQLIKEVLFPPE